MIRRWDTRVGPPSAYTPGNGERLEPLRRPRPHDPGRIVVARRRILAVVAHPDDESFGLGAILSTFARGGAATSVLCFTHGEASTLHGVAGELSTVRARELEDAAQVLGVGEVRLLDHPDGGLPDVGIDTLAGDLLAMADTTLPDLLLVFDEGGVTGHPDHRRATEAACHAVRSRQLQVAAWALPDYVAQSLNAEFGTGFVGRSPSELDFRLRVDRSCQRQAITCHRSQSRENPALQRRLDLLGDTEWLRILEGDAVSTNQT